MAAILDFKMAATDYLFSFVSPKLNGVGTKFQRLHLHFGGQGIRCHQFEKAAPAAILDFKMAAAKNRFSAVSPELSKLGRRFQWLPPIFGVEEYDGTN